MSEDTIGSSVYSRIPLSGPSLAAAANAALTFSLVVGRSVSTLAIHRARLPSSSSGFGLASVTLCRNSLNAIVIA